MKYVSANLAHPGLKPKAASASTTTTSAPAASVPDHPAPAQKEF